MELDADDALSEALLDRYFYEGLRPSIKLWIDEDGWKLLAWDDLVKKSSRAEAKAKIQNNWDLDQRCHRGKRPLKLMKKARNEHPEKVQQKTAATSQGQGKTNQAKQGNKPKKKRRDGDTRHDGIDEAKREMVAPLQLELMLPPA